MTTVFLLDDHEIVRRGVAELINAEPDLEVIGQCIVDALAELTEGRESS